MMTKQRTRILGERVELLFSVVVGVFVWGTLLLFGPLSHRFGSNTTAIAGGIALSLSSYVAFGYTSLRLKQLWMLWTTGLILVALGAVLLADLPFLMGWNGGALALSALLPLSAGVSMLVYAQRLKQSQLQVQPQLEVQVQQQEDTKLPKEKGAMYEHRYSSSSTLSSWTGPTTKLVEPTDDPMTAKKCAVLLYFFLLLAAGTTIILLPSLQLSDKLKMPYQTLSLIMCVPIILGVVGFASILLKNKVMIFFTCAIFSLSVIGGIIGTMNLFYSFQKDGHPSWTVLLALGATLIHAYVGHALSRIWKGLDNENGHELDDDDEYVFSNRASMV